MPLCRAMIPACPRPVPTDSPSPVEVEPGHPAYDDPEWAADAARGALDNVYDLRAIYTDIEQVELDQPI